VPSHHPTARLQLLLAFTQYSHARTTSRETTVNVEMSQEEVARESSNRSCARNRARKRTTRRRHQTRARAIGGDGVSENKLAALKQVENQKRVEQVYQNYILDPVKHETEFYKEVFKFAKHKLWRIESENQQTIRNSSDFAQDVTVDVWRQLATNFRPNNFHAWLCKIVNNTKNDFISEIDDQKKNKVGVMVIMDDDDGAKEEVENPLLHASSGYGQFLNIPSSVTGIDLNICKMLLTQVRGKDGNHRGRNYAEVARALRMTEDAVKTRLLKLRTRLKADKNEERAKNLNAPMEAARKHRERADADLVRIRAENAAKVAATEPEFEETEEVMVTR